MGVDCPRRIHLDLMVLKIKTVIWWKVSICWKSDHYISFHHYHSISRSSKWEKLIKSWSLKKGTYRILGILLVATLRYLLKNGWPTWDQSTFLKMGNSLRYPLEVWNGTHSVPWNYPHICNTNKAIEKYFVWFTHMIWVVWIKPFN